MCIKVKYVFFNHKILYFHFSLPIGNGLVVAQVSSQHIARLVAFRKEEPIGWFSGLATQRKDLVDLSARPPLIGSVSAVRECQIQATFDVFARVFTDCHTITVKKDREDNENFMVDYSCGTNSRFPTPLISLLKTKYNETNTKKS